MEMSLKTGFAQIFSCCPKFGRGGGLQPPSPPGPYVYGKSLRAALKYTMAGQMCVPWLT